MKIVSLPEQDHMNPSVRALDGRKRELLDGLENAVIALELPKYVPRLVEALVRCQHEMGGRKLPPGRVRRRRWGTRVGAREEGEAGGQNAHTHPLSLARTARREGETARLAVRIPLPCRAASSVLALRSSLC